MTCRRGVSALVSLAHVADRAGYLLPPLAVSPAACVMIAPRPAWVTVLWLTPTPSALAEYGRIITASATTKALRTS